MKSSSDSIAWISAKDLLQSHKSGELSKGEIIDASLARVNELDNAGPCLRAVISQLKEYVPVRGRNLPEGELNGLPILVKDNIDTSDYPTTAGSLALEGSHPSQNAPIIQALVELGATVIGKTNLSEWSNFRGKNSISGWSAIGGQTLNPYVLDRSPGGSSSGSAVSVAAGYVPVALGTETDGSIICPAAVNGVVGFKPTHGVLPTKGIIPISSSQDTVGIFARCISDVAFIFGNLLDVLGRSALYGGSFSNEYEKYKKLQTAVRIGIPRIGFFGYSVKLDQVFEEAINAISASGVEIVDEVDLKFATDFSIGLDDEMLVFLWELNRELNKYLHDRNVEGVRSISDLIGFNQRHAKEELAYFGQEHFEKACALNHEMYEQYQQSQTNNIRRTETAILKTLTLAEVDVLCVPSMSPSWVIDRVNGDAIAGSGYSVAAVAGVCSINVPIGLVGELPVGMTLIASYHEDAKLLAIAERLESILSVRLRPKFFKSI